MEHIVHINDADDFLSTTVAPFLSAALGSGHPAVIVATEPNRATVRAKLASSGIDVPRLIESGQLVLLDACRVLDDLVQSGEPDGALFATTMSRVIEEMLRAWPGARVRIYSELTELLLREGNEKNAARFEELWNELGHTYAISLLSAHPSADHHEARGGAPENPPRRASDSPHARAVQAEERLRLFVESVNDYAIFMLDPDGRVASWNVGAERIKGYKDFEIVGKHFSIFYPHEDVSAGKCELELDVATREGRFEDEGWRLRKDGSKFWANVVITAVYDEERRLLGFGKVTRDLTARREAEAERIERARAEEGQRQREEFLAVLGHELRNPLASMATAVHLLKLKPDVGRQKEMIVLDRQLTHMLRLLDDLLDVARTLHNKVQLAPEPMEIRQVLSNALENTAPLIEQKHHRLHLDVPSTPLLVAVDPQRIVQVFANLLNNAAKYTEAGGEIRVRAFRQGDDVHVSIEDTGIGIAPEFMNRLFELFTQGHDGVTRHFGGLGIGLAVAKHLAIDHGGDISVHSDGPGRGSTFTVRLPESKATPAGVEVEGPSNSPYPAPESRRVLVVEDNQDAAELMRILLERLGYQVAVATDGARGLELADEFEPDIALLDIGLPGMNGLEVARRLRQVPAFAEIPIIALSGYVRDIDRKAALAAGFSEHLAKPFDPSRLEQILRRPKP